METVRAPATCANLGSGYDTLGLALSRPMDTISVTRAGTTTIELAGPEAAGVPVDPEANTAGAVAQTLGVEAEIHLEKRVPPGSGLGSSGASAAGAAVALDRLYDLGLTRTELVRAAAAGETVAAGSPHADNVAAAICGGLAVVSADRVASLPTSIPVVVCLPEVTVRTARARAVVPDEIDTGEHVTALGRVATVILGVCRSDPALVGAGMEASALTAPRRDLVPGFTDVVAAADAAGASGVCMSGAGPSLLAVCDAADRSAVGEAMVDAFASVDVDATAIETAVGAGIEPDSHASVSS